MQDDLRLYEITSNSMAPLMKSGDFVLTRTIKSRLDLSRGDCLIYKSERLSPTCHRLIKIKNGVLYLKGDSSIYLDKPVSIEDVLGKVVAIKKRGHLIFLNTFSRKVRAMVKVYLFLISEKWRNFLERVAYVFSLPPGEFIIRLRRKVIRKFKHG